MSGKIKKLITHNGSFHTDDIFAAATLIIYLEKNNKEFSAQGGPASGWEIIRTRDPDIIKTGDYVFDVGGIYDEATNRFDHHQVGGAGRDENDIEYSSFGLVWKKFGVEVCGSQKTADIIKKKLVSPVDASDNGMDLFTSKYDVSPYLIQYFFFSMVPTWREKDISKDKMFLESIEIAKKVLLREIAHARDFVLAEDSMVKIYENTKNKSIIVFDEDYPSADMFPKFTETLFIVYPRSDTTWGVKAIRDNLASFKNRKNLPESWGGLKDKELQKVTEVPDAIFCHRALFMVVAKSKEGAIKLAQLALEPST